MLLEETFEILRSIDGDIIRYDTKDNQLNLCYGTEDNPMFEVPEVLVSHLPLQVLLAPLQLGPMFPTDRPHRLPPLLHLAGEDLPEGGIELADWLGVVGLRHLLEVLEGALPHPPGLDGGGQTGVVGGEAGQVEVQVDEDQGDGDEEAEELHHLLVTSHEADQGQHGLTGAVPPS